MATISEQIDQIEMDLSEAWAEYKAASLGVTTYTINSGQTSKSVTRTPSNIQAYIKDLNSRLKALKRKLGQGSYSKRFYG